MPSSLIIVALAAAWLVVLVPMIARGRQEVSRTSDSALAARVVRSASARTHRRKEFAMAENGKPGDDVPADDQDLLEDGYDEDLEHVDDEHEDDDAVAPEPERAKPTKPTEATREQRVASTYRPGRGGFDPEAAEIAARAKYRFRQRVVLGLLLSVVLTLVLAAVVLPAIWWVHALVDVSLVGYLVYLRRQVRIEEEIRQRRLARMHSVPRRGPRPIEPELPASPEDVGDDEASDYDDEVEEVEVVAPPVRDVVGSERRPTPTTRIRRQAVVVDLDDEDPAFHELDDPGQLPYRRAAGE